MKCVIRNIACIVNGSWRDPFTEGSFVATEDGLITYVGEEDAKLLNAADVVIDAGGATMVPGFIDSQIHNTFGDYTPRQKTVGFLESYLHGGTTTAISASEVHVPGRPVDPEGVKALAIAAQRSFEHYRPGGMRMLAGSVILEPGLVADDFQELYDKGVRLAKAGFGAVETPFDYAPMVHAARDAGLITTVHTGGASIPGSGAITGDHLLAMNPHVSFHINGGPVAMPDADFERVILESEIALQVCTAGNLRTMILCAELARKHDAFDRFLIATDTPTGSGVMPLGMLYSMINLAALTDFPPEWMIAASTGNVADIYRLNSGYLQVGRDADLVIIDSPDGGTQDDALSAMRHGDMVAVGAVITDGVPRFVGRSRNTPPTVRTIAVERCSVPQQFDTSKH
ncbi:MAG: amidohydrolase family protein [Pseudomonadota bacterium]